MTDRLLPSGLRARLSLSIAVILVAALSVTFVVTYRETGSTLRDELDTELRTEAQAFDRGLGHDARPAALAAAGRRYVQAQVFGPSARLLILRLDDGPTVTNDPELVGLLKRDPDREDARVQRRENAQARALVTAPPGLSTVQVEDIGAVRLITRPVERSGTRVGLVRVGEPLASVERAQDGVVGAFLLAGSLALLGALAAAYFVAARTADPLRRMARTAAAIDAGDLSHRMRATGSSEEVRILSESFDHMLDRLDEAFERQREFVSDASHELRTPLTVIRGQLEVLARSADVSADDVRRVEGVVAREVARMQRLVDELLLLARTEEEGRFHPRPVDTGLFVAEQLEAIRPTAARRFELGPVVEGTVVADPDALAQAIRNLTRNAVEHTTDGGSVWLSAQARGDRVEFAVEDDGPGIPAAERGRVFERFHRVESSGGPGSGLGLAIARVIVEAHGGSIWADEAPGGGARVAFQLPGFTPRSDP